MHSPKSPLTVDPVSEACDAVLDAFIDSFTVPVPQEQPLDRWLKRLIDELEGAREDLTTQLRSMTHLDYRKNLSRAIRRVENVLAQLYEEQLHH